MSQIASLQISETLGRQFLVVQWTSATRQSYFKDSAVHDFEKHESVHNTMRPNGVDLKDCLTLYTNTEKLDASEAWLVTSGYLLFLHINVFLYLFVFFTNWITSQKFREFIILCIF